MTWGNTIAQLVEWPPVLALPIECVAKLLPVALPLNVESQIIQKFANANNQVISDTLECHKKQALQKSAALDNS